MRLPQAPVRYDPRDQQETRTTVEREVAQMKTLFPAQPIPHASLGNSGAAITAPWSAARPVLHVTLTANATITISALVPGATLRLHVLTGTGSHTATFALASGLGSLRWFGGSAPTVTATASKVDVFEFTFDGVDTVAKVVGQAA